MAALVLASSGCLSAIPPPPTLGYGAPYRGTGETIFVKDSRTDWDISEGANRISAEQALEATGDPEYEARRQIAKAYNAKLYEEAKRNRKNGYRMIGGSIAAFVGGLVVSFGVAPTVANEDVTAPTGTAPEMVHTTAGGASVGAALVGTVLMLAGVVGTGYGFYGAIRPPTYQVWRIPDPLNRPAYIRRFTEEYNAKIEASELRPPPGVRPPRSIPRPRGGAR